MLDLMDFLVDRWRLDTKRNGTRGVHFILPAVSKVTNDLIRPPLYQLIEKGRLPTGLFNHALILLKLSHPE
jgi:hypothetical protein